MKKFLALTLAVLMLLSLCACGPKDTGKDDTNKGDNSAAKALLSEAFIDPVNGWAKYDDLIAQIKASTDTKKRTELMHQAEDILM